MHYDREIKTKSIVMFLKTSRILYYYSRSKSLSIATGVQAFGTNVLFEKTVPSPNVPNPTRPEYYAFQLIPHIICPLQRLLEVMQIAIQETKQFSTDTQLTLRPLP